jgi:hypothetical protein
MRSERVKTCIRANFETGGGRGEGLIRNVSGGGLFVGTGSLPEVGETVEVTARGAGGADVRISGLVWWTSRNRPGTNFTRPRGFGIRLLDTEQDARQLLGA